MEPLFNQFGKYAVQKAIDALRENGGGQVSMKRLDWNCTATLNFIWKQERCSVSRMIPKIIP